VLQGKLASVTIFYHIVIVKSIYIQQALACILPIESEGILRILGIDPGTAIIGHGLVQVCDSKLKCGFSESLYGSIHTDKEKRDELRLRELYDAMVALIRSYQPDVIAIERLFFARNVTTAMGVGQARGVILLAAEQAHKPVFQYTPLQVKQQITGYGKAEKKQVQAMTKRILELEEIRTKLDDAWDALAIAITHSYKSGLVIRPDYIVDNVTLKPKAKKIKVVSAMPDALI